jgi:hypothetical protein
MKTRVKSQIPYENEVGDQVLFEIPCRKEKNI